MTRGADDSFRDRLTALAVNVRFGLLGTSDSIKPEVGPVPASRPPIGGEV
jgi:hypothetical protein